MNDHELEAFWKKNQPEDYEGWEEGTLKFARPPKKLIQLRMEPRDIRIIDRESKRSSMDRAFLIVVIWLKICSTFSLMNGFFVRRIPYHLDPQPH